MVIGPHRYGADVLKFEEYPDPVEGPTLKPSLNDPDTIQLLRHGLRGF